MAFPEFFKNYILRVFYAVSTIIQGFFSSKFFTALNDINVEKFVSAKLQNFLDCKFCETETSFAGMCEACLKCFVHKGLGQKTNIQ
jgi:hypothetical protein